MRDFSPAEKAFRIAKVDHLLGPPWTVYVAISCLTLSFELPFNFFFCLEPIVQRQPLPAAARAINLVGALADLFRSGRWRGRSHGRRALILFGVILFGGFHLVGSFFVVGSRPGRCTLEQGRYEVIKVEIMGVFN